VLLGTLLALALAAPGRAQPKPDPQAQMVLDSARRAFNDKDYPFAATRFREFLQKYASHREAPAAHYGLALCLLQGPDRDHVAAAGELQPLAGNTSLPEHPFVLYYLGLAHRGQGVRALAQATIRPAEANQHQDTARQRFEEAAKHFAAAVTALDGRVPKKVPAAGPPPAEVEWAARARCDLAEMLLRQGRAKEAQAAAAPVAEQPRWAASRFRSQGLYYHALASFLLKDMTAAGRSLNRLTAMGDPVVGTHARYLLARVHHEAGERPEARGHYEGALADYAREKQAAAQHLQQPERFKNDPDEKARLGALANGLAPDHVARATFFLGVLLYEEGHFADALTRFQALTQQFPQSPLAPEAKLRQGCCQVQLRQLDDALTTLQLLVDGQPRLADQALLWLGKAQLGKADPANPAAHEQAVRAAVETFRKAADRANQMISGDPGARQRRGEALVEAADAMQRIKRPKEAAALYGQVLADKMLPAREDELLHSVATAWQLAGDYNESDKVCQQFLGTRPMSPLRSAVLFRYAENAAFSGLAAETIPDLNQRKKEVDRLNDEALKRYQAVVDKYPAFTHANLARLGVGISLYRKGDLEKARAALAAIPAAHRDGPLALTGYYLGDIMLRTAPARATDTTAAGKLQEHLKAAAEQLDAFAASAADAPQAADALVKLGYCHQRLAGLVAQPGEQARELAGARAAYEQVLQRFPQTAAFPTAVFERAKVLARAKDTGGAVSELRRFLADPLQASPVAPMACLHLATLLRADNKPAEAAALLEQCRKDHEAKLQADSARAAWVPLLRYHQGVALREAGKRPEARAVLELVIQQGIERPEGAEAALRVGQCLREEAEARLAEGRSRQAQPNLKPEEQAAAQKVVDDGTAGLRAALQYFTTQAEQLRQKQAATQARTRMLYEAAWLARGLAGIEVAAARKKAQLDQWQKRREELAKLTPPGQELPFVPLPEVPLKELPLQPAEAEARAQYQALIAAFPELAVNADARFELAEMLCERGEFDPAVKLLREALDRKPPTDVADKVRLRLGDALLARGDAKAALQQFSPVTANAASAVCAEATYRAGEACLRMGDPGEAVKRLALFRDKFEFQTLPGLTDRGLLRLGHALALLKQWDSSRQACEQVVGRFGTGPWVDEARYAAGWAYQNMGQYDNAVNAYTPLAACGPTELGARAQMNIGLCRLAQKRYPEASTALLVVPFTYDYPKLSALALVEAARAFAENKQTEQAERLLQRVLRDHPGTEHAEVARQRLAALKKG
jgi:TolA-binding protein